MRVDYAQTQHGDESSPLAEPNMSTLPIPTDKLFKTMALGGITIIGGTIALLAFAYISKRSAESEYLRANAALKRENVLYDTASESAQLEQQGIQRDQQCVSDEADDAKKEHSNVSSLLDHEISLVTSEAACAQTPEEKLAVIEKIRRLVDELYSCQAKAIRKSRERVARMQQLLESYSPSYCNIEAA